MQQTKQLQTVSNISKHKDSNNLLRHQVMLRGMMPPVKNGCRVSQANLNFNPQFETSNWRITIMLQGWATVEAASYGGPPGPVPISSNTRRARARCYYNFDKPLFINTPKTHLAKTNPLQAITLHIGDC